tara:strand:- start:286 stop:552 length:267 start_codon:yes stop_codon:yes gene_type:complete
MAEKVLDKLKRLSRDLAESVRVEIELADKVREQHKELQTLKMYLSCYLLDKENILETPECISFLKGYYDAKKTDEVQLKFNFPESDKD